MKSDSLKASSSTSGVRIPAPADDLCLAFANTRYWRGSDPVTETLGDAAALGAWLDANAPEARPLRKKESEQISLNALFDEAIALRESIYRIFLSVAEQEPPPSRDLDALNRMLARAPQRLGVVVDGQTFSWLIPSSPQTGLGCLAPVLWSAADMLTHSTERRIRRCANDKCQWVFLDRSKGGTRRWCDMNSCGNRAKAHRHYARSKQD